MPRHAPPPGYSHAYIIKRFPRQWLTADMLQHADATQIGELWRQVCKDVLAALIAGERYRVPFLGVFSKTPKTREHYPKADRSGTWPARNAWHVTYEPSTLFRNFIRSGEAGGADEWTPDMSRTLEAVKLTPEQGKKAWAAMAFKVMVEVYHGNDFKTPGFGAFVKHRMPAIHYRNWKTGAMAATAPGVRVDFVPSPSALDWLTAGALPANA